jgi:hypothetical protein
MGDMHGAALIRTLLDEASLGKKIIEIYAIGGQRMKNSGAILIGGCRVSQISPSHMAFFGPVFFFSLIRPEVPIYNCAMEHIITV